MSIIPVTSPDLPVLWHNAVVDIEPTSQYGLDRDLTSVNSTLCYEIQAKERLPVTFYAPSTEETECNIRRQSRERPAHQDATPLEPAAYRPIVQALERGGWGAQAMNRILERSTKHFVGSAELEPGRQVVRFHTRVPIRPDAEGAFEFALAAPLGAGARVRSAALSVVVLLPNDAPDYHVDVIDWSKESAPGADVVVFGGEGRARLAGRTAVAWSWVSDPFVWLKYRYVR